MIRLYRNLLALVLAFAAVGMAPMHAHAAATPAAKAVADADKLDINSASADQLKALKGVGDVYSKRIIAGRPYTAKNQLVTKGIVPQATYDNIKDLIVARAPKK